MDADTPDQKRDAEIPYRSAAWLRKHVGHEIQWFAFAVAEFREGHRHEVPLQDSALMRARSLLEFFTNRRKDGIGDFYRAGVEKRMINPKDRWYKWICDRLAHLGPERETGQSHDQWPHAEPGVEKGPDRLRYLADHVFTTIKDRLPDLDAVYADVVREVTSVARSYVGSPSPGKWRALSATVVQQAEGW